MLNNAVLALNPPTPLSEEKISRFPAIHTTHAPFLRCSQVGWGSQLCFCIYMFLYLNILPYFLCGHFVEAPR